MANAHKSLSLLGIAVIYFTVIIIIVAPLAFVTALFALLVDIFKDKKVKFSDDAQDEGMNVYSKSYIGKRLGEPAMSPSHF